MLDSPHTVDADDWLSACDSSPEEDRETLSLHSSLPPTLHLSEEAGPEDEDSPDLSDVALLVKTLEEIDASLRQKAPKAKHPRRLRFDETAFPNTAAEASLPELLRVLQEKQSLFETPLRADVSEGERVFAAAFATLNNCSRRKITDAAAVEALCRRAITLGNCAYSLKANASVLEAATRFCLRSISLFCFQLDPVAQILTAVRDVLARHGSGVGLEDLTESAVEGEKAFNSAAEPVKIEINFGRYCSELVLGIRITQHFSAAVNQGGERIGEIRGCVRFESPIQESGKPGRFNPRCSFRFVQPRQGHPEGSLVEEEQPVAREEDPKAVIGRSRKRRLDRWTANTDLLAWGASHTRAKLDTAEVIPVWGVLDLVRIASISCSAYHALLLTDVGLVFSWGDGSDGSLGHADFSECPYPRYVSALGDNQPKPILATHIAAGSDISGSHSACVSRDGRLFTWGLGIACGRNTMKSSAVPTPIEASAFKDEEIETVECGGGFTVAVSKRGRVFAFGTYSNGRLGIGEPVLRRGLRYRSNNSIAKYVLSPRPVRGSLAKAKVVKVACGKEHCLALDDKGTLYSWGNGNAGQLGNGKLGIALAPHKIRSGIVGEQNVLTGLPAMSQISCGSLHSLALDKEGKIYSWGSYGRSPLGHGEYSSAPARYSAVRAEDEEEAEVKTDSSEKQAVPLLRPNIEEEQPWRWPKQVEAVLGVQFSSTFAGDGVSGAVTKGGDLYQWGHGKDDGPLFVDLRSKYIESGACGGKNYFAITSGSHVGNDLLKEFQRLNEEVQKGRSMGMADVKLVVGSYELYAHKAILGCRSAELRRRIVLEERYPEELTTVNLSDLSIETAEVLLEYIYGDCVYKRIDPTSTMPEEVAAVARNYEMHGLLRLGNSARLNPEKLEEEGVEQDLCTDLLKLVNEPSWADLTFTTSDGMSVYAHKAILTMRSGYFRQMFSSPGRQSIKVPDRKASLLRMLTYLYCGQTSTEGLIDESQFVQDLHGCNRYKLSRLQQWYEANARINVENCLRLLNITHYIQAPVLKRKLHLFIARNLDVVSKQKAFKVLSADYPVCVQSVVHTAKAINAQAREVNDYGKHATPFSWFTNSHDAFRFRVGCCT